MSSKCMCVAGVLAVLTLTPTTLVAENLNPADPAFGFATCAGRMFALTEHNWTYGHDSTRSERDYRHFSDLVDATSRPEIGSAILSIRVEARMGLRRLLSKSVTSTDRGEKHWLERRLTRMINDCRGMLLS